MQQNQRFDLVLFSITITLIGIGLLMIYSSSAIFAQRYHTGDTYYYFKRQILWIALGSIGLFAAWTIDYRKWQKWSLRLIVIGIVFLIMTLIMGHKIGGARRWLKILDFTFQSSEFIKLAFVIYLSSFIIRKEDKIKSLYQGLIPSLIFLAIISGLLLLQPHLGMTFLLIVTTATILSVGGADMQHIGFLSIIAIGLTIVLIFAAPYRFKRVTGFWNPWKDPEGVGYHIIQSMIAFGSGGMFGVGLGESKQKLFYLPESSTDFIFAIIGEEGGFLLTSTVIILFIGFAYFGIKIALQINEKFGSLLSFSITVLIIIQALLNMGVVTGILPTTGMPLPFISFGGSALLFNMIGVGILLNIAKKSSATKYTLIVR